MKNRVLFFLFCFAIPLYAQESLPVGTVLPVRLNSTLSLKSRPGQMISARVMQRVPVNPGFTIPAGSKVFGHVIEVIPSSGASGAAIVFSFGTLVVSHHKVPIVTDLRALASPMEIDSAQIPDTGPDRGTAPAVYTTNQVGGEVVYRGGRPVTDGSEVVGEPVPDGVLGKIRPGDSGRCRGEIEGNDRPQALWIFSTDACGMYGAPGLEIAHAGRSEPVGTIRLTSKDNNLKIRGGSGMLLRVVAAPSTTASSLASLPDNRSLGFGASL